MSNELKPGGRALLVYAHESYSDGDGRFPKVGSVGTVETRPDQEGECDVFFPECVWGWRDPSWIVPAAWLVKIPPDDDCKRLFRETERPVAA